MSQSEINFVCYDWQKKVIVHQKISLDEVSNGKHKKCGKRVAILKSDYDPDNLELRRELTHLKIDRWYQIPKSTTSAPLMIGVLPRYPDPVDYVRMLIKKRR